MGVVVRLVEPFEVIAQDAEVSPRVSNERETNSSRAEEHPSCNSKNFKEDPSLKS